MCTSSRGAEPPEMWAGRLPPGWRPCHVSLHWLMSLSRVRPGALPRCLPGQGCCTLADPEACGSFRAPHDELEAPWKQKDGGTVHGHLQARARQTGQQWPATDLSSAETGPGVRSSGPRPPAQFQSHSHRDDMRGHGAPLSPEATCPGLRSQRAVGLRAGTSPL